MPITFRKRGYFSESYDHWRHWRESGNGPDQWRAKLPPRCGQPLPAGPRPAIPATSAPLVPLDAPWRDGQRYNLAGATEWPGKLDLYRADPAGPWIRRHGVVIAVSNS